VYITPRSHLVFNAGNKTWPHFTSWTRVFFGGCFLKKLLTAKKTTRKGEAKT